MTNVSDNGIFKIVFADGKLMRLNLNYFGIKLQKQEISKYLPKDCVELFQDYLGKIECLYFNALITESENSLIRTRLCYQIIELMRNNEHDVKLHHNHNLGEWS